jgi:hypothetical protein
MIESRVKKDARFVRREIALRLNLKKRKKFKEKKLKENKNERFIR